MRDLRFNWKWLRIWASRGDNLRARWCMEHSTAGRLLWATQTTLHGHPKTLAARTRLLWHDFITHGLRNQGGERCEDCGRDYVLWWCHDDTLWLKAKGSEYGLLCPWCFAERLERYGMRVRFDSHAWFIADEGGSRVLESGL